jgi:hypothetical protein
VFTVILMASKAGSRLASKDRGTGGKRTQPQADVSGGNGSEVAPTAKATARERERHRLQRAVGVVPAGEDGNRRQVRSGGVKRGALDAAAREADRRVK